MPRRLQGVDEADIDLRTTLLGHQLPLPVFTCPTGAEGVIHVKAELPNAAGNRHGGHAVRRLGSVRTGRWKRSPRRRPDQNGFRST